MQKQENVATSMEQIFVDNVLNSLKNGVIHIGIGTSLARDILPFVQKVISRARYIDVEDGSTIFYMDTIKEQAISHIKKCFVGYKNKTEACSSALELLTNIVFDLQPNDVIEILERKTNTNTAKKTYLNVGSRHKVKRVYIPNYRNEIIVDVLPLDVTRNSKDPLTITSRLYKFKKVES